MGAVSVAHQQALHIIHLLKHDPLAIQSFIETCSPHIKIPVQTFLDQKAEIAAKILIANQTNLDLFFLNGKVGEGEYLLQRLGLCLAQALTGQQNAPEQTKALFTQLLRA